MIASFLVYMGGCQLEVRFGSLLGCSQIIFLENHLAFRWIVEYTFNLLFDLNYKFINGSLASSPG